MEGLALCKYPPDGCTVQGCEIGRDEAIGFTILGGTVGDFQHDFGYGSVRTSVTGSCTDHD